MTYLNLLLQLIALILLVGALYLKYTSGINDDEHFRMNVYAYLLLIISFINKEHK